MATVTTTTTTTTTIAKKTTTNPKSFVVDKDEQQDEDDSELFFSIFPSQTICLIFSVCILSHDIVPLCPKESPELSQAQLEPVFSGSHVTKGQKSVFFQIR